MMQFGLSDMIRKARMADVKQIHTLLTYYADRKLLLGRSISSIYDHLRDFIVYDDNGGTITGVCSLQICWENLAEIRSLAVAEDVCGRGIGAEMVRTCLKEAEDYGILRVFVLTYQSEFFQKQGFMDIDKRELPHKIWSDCINCPMFPDCDEEALLYEVNS